MKKQLFALALLGLFAAPLWAADECSTVIEGNDSMQYDKSEITVPASCDEFTVELQHVGSLPVAAMGHNWVLSASDDMEGIVADGADAGPDEGYLKADDDRVIAHTDLIGGGESSSVTFKVADVPEDNMFYCSFPGHEAMMNGKIVIEE